MRMVVSEAPNPAEDINQWRFHGSPEPVAYAMSLITSWCSRRHRLRRLGQQRGRLSGHLARDTAELYVRMTNYGWLLTACLQRAWGHSETGTVVDCNFARLGIAAGYA